MAKLTYYIHRTGITYEAEADNDFHAIEVIKDLEGIKRVPPTWLIWLNYEDGKGMIPVNRRAIARHRAEAKAKAKAKVNE